MPIGQRRPVPCGETYNGWNERSVYGYQPIVADDWICDSTKPVTDIHWWGSYIRWSETYPPQVPDAFHIAIWTDVPAMPPDFSHPGEVVWENWCDKFTWKFVGWDLDPHDPGGPQYEACFKFEQDLTEDEWFWQDPGENIYWISIAAIYDSGAPADYPWGWKTRPHNYQDDGVRILDPMAPGVGSLYQNGEPIYWPNPEDSWDMAFVLTTTRVPIGSLTFEPNHYIRDHYWWDDPADPENEMLSFTVSADATEAVSWDSVTLQAWGTGDDWADIGAVNVWRDNDNDGKVTAADTLLGTGTYPGDNGSVTIALAPAPIIPVGGSVSALISYDMNSPIPPGGTYMFAITGASGTGQTSGQPVPIYGLPLTSAKKTVSVRPISIGAAKKLAPIGTPFILQGKVLTADLRTYGDPVMNLFYIEEEDRSAGIGVVDMLGLGALNVGDRVYLEGTCFLLNACELVIDPDYVSTATGTAITPVGMNNKFTGGGVFGGQPDLVDDAYALPPKMSVGLNDVGMLIRTWGRVTCYQPLFITPSITGDMFWINDGAGLMDGFLTALGPPTVGVDVLQAPQSAAPDVGDYYSVTGILRAIPNFVGDPVRLLVPRDPSDMDYNPEP